MLNSYFYYSSPLRLMSLGITLMVLLQFERFVIVQNLYFSPKNENRADGFKIASHSVLLQVISN